MDEDPLPLSSHATTIPDSPPLFTVQFHAHKSSSPPPLFSENDSLDSADVTRYESPRLKRKRAGTWWEQTGPSAVSRKRQFERNFDSGVHMMSDDSETSAASSFARSSGFEDTLDIPSDPPVPEHGDEGIERGSRAMTDREANFYRDIQEAVDANATSYAFTNREIEDNWLHHLQMLNQVVTVPPYASTEVPDEGQYRSMEPELHLNLSMNNLCRLSPTLFNLQYLTGLTLRNNAIEAIPPQIAQLTKLVRLDLCHNLIRTLPCEILSLCAPGGNLTHLELTGNPLCEVGAMNDGICTTVFNTGLLHRHVYDPQVFSLLANDPTQPFSSNLWARLWRHLGKEWGDFDGHHLFTPRSGLKDEDWVLVGSRNIVYLLSRTTAAYYDQSGRLVKGSPPLPMQERRSLSDTATRTQPGLMVHTPLGAEGVPAAWFDPPSLSRIPSLFTQSLTTAYKHSESEGKPEEVRKAMGYDNPSTIEASLVIAEQNMVEAYQPFQTCHCCGKKYIVPRAEWIEGWYFNQQVIPVKVAVCSWGCVPDVISKRPEPLSWNG